VRILWRSVTDREVLRLIGRSTFAIRMAIATAIFGLAAWRADIVVGNDVVQLGGVGAALVFAVFALAVVTLLQVSLAGRRFGQSEQLGGVSATAGGVLDVAWLAVGYAASGGATLVFPPLLVLLVTMHGVLLPPLGALLVAAAGGAMLTVVHALAPPATLVSLSTQAQMAVFVGLGIVSVMMGNRLRAAVWAVGSLDSLVKEMDVHARELLEQLPAGMLTISTDGRLRGNAEALRLLGAEGARTAGDMVAALDDTAPQLAIAVREAMSGPSGRCSGETRIDGGSPRWVAWSVIGQDVPDAGRVTRSALAAPVGAAGRSHLAPDRPRVRAAVVVLGDATERRAVEERRAESRRIDAVAELSASFAHEVRNPLAALLSATEQLSESEWADPVDRRLLSVLSREAGRMNRLVGDFLEFARVGGGAVARHNLKALTHDSLQAARSLAEAKGVVLQVDMPSATLLADADLYHRALSNVTLNAVQFTPPGERVDVSGVVDRSRGWLIVRVQDSGPGVDEGLRHRIFTPFYTRRAGGSGLGLPIAARSLSLLGGTLRLVQSNEMAPAVGGAVFELSLPLEPAD
jgi:two-component system, NtrC family, sensor histidine kinase PilS